MNISIGSVVKVYNNNRVKLGIVKSIDEKYAVVQVIVNQVMNVEEKVEVKDLEPVNLFKELNLARGSMLKRK
jgi:hypothetical protein